MAEISTGGRPARQEIRLRPLDENDRALYLFAFTDAGMMRFVGEPVSESRAERAFRKACASNAESVLKSRAWVVEIGSPGESAGLLSVSVQGRSAEIGGMILPRWQGMGISGHAFPMGMAEVFAFDAVDEMLIRFRCDNGLAAGLMPKIGFVRVAESHPDDGLERWVLRRDEWMLLDAVKRDVGKRQ